MIRAFRGKFPQIDPSVYVAENATVVGDVHIGARSSLWFGAVLRGDVFHIRVGNETSIQDNTVIHVTHDRFATIVGNRVTVGHSVTLHGCTIGDLCIIGIGANVLDQVEVGERCIVGAGALLTPGTKVPPGHLVVGAPARVKRPLSEAELAWLAASAAHYVELGRIYAEEARSAADPAAKLAD
jgi:carbonic anhydrase/acetyltransferase-like protein (isoleucine patch superfamily)